MKKSLDPLRFHALNPSIIKNFFLSRSLVLPLLLLLIIVGLEPASAQQVRKVSGRVLDQKGAPIPGASVIIKRSTQGGIADKDGKFSLSVPDNANVLVISYIGMKTLEVEIGSRTDLSDITLSEESVGLQEVVVTALGIERAAKTLTYSTQKIGSEQINEVRDANFTNTLSGKVAGLTITPSSSGPGSATRIILRGNRSIQGTNNALIVVDGVPIDNSTISGQVRNDSGDDNRGNSGSDGVANLNPDDIESINILKGAAGAALYGSRAANGVMMITTKKGKSGALSVNVNSGVSFDKAFTSPNLQNQYSQGAGGIYSALGTGSWGAAITGQSVTDWAGNTVPLQAYPDNITDFYRTGISTNNAIGVSGGTEKMTTYFSYANNNANGIVPTNSLTRNTFNGRLGINITSKLSVDAKITYTLQKIKNKPGVGGDGFVVANLSHIPRSVNLEDLKDYKTISSTGIETQRYWTNPDPVYMNPYWTIYNTKHLENRSRVTSLIAIKYKFTDWLNIQGRISSDSYNDFNTHSYSNNTANYARLPGGYYAEENALVSERNIDILLNGTNNITKDIKINYNLGGSMLMRNLRRRVNYADGLGIPNKFDLGFATNLGVTSSTSKRDLHSVYGTAQFAFKDYLFLDLTARNDWSSTLPEPYSYFYPSIGLSGVLSEMVHLPNWVSLAKVRASLTKVGNDADPYLINQTYTYSRGSFGGFVSSSPTKSIGNLKPELTQSLEFGTDWRFMENRFGIDVTYYKTNSKNQLLTVSAPASSGYASRYFNAGNIQNTGVEVVLSARILRSDKFTWNMGLNYALNRNKVIELDPRVPRVYLGSGTNVRTATPLVVEGQSYGDMYGYKWKQLNGQYLVDANGVPIKTDAIEKVGNYNPKFTAGFSNNFSYKNWTLGLLIDGKFGGIVTSGSAAQNAYFGNADYTTQYREAGSWVLPGVTAEGTANNKAINAEKFWTTVSQNNYSWAEFFTYDATAVRVRELTFGYEFKGLPTFIKTAKISFVARNLFFIYRGDAILDIPGIGKRKIDFDPEVSIGNSNYQGIEYNNLPATRSMGLNLKLSF
ncbi:SusC/RagA family TonB-linked outer membrane protein [Dyadobacter pollutisoli]|uniref:SusC/RagA family TonB-linked outer membrane protein n=1 Tax=Dyadobacter pollutisoli TaxID=2910158 RepID=A0A9E8SJW9_9BACT|nr:SusC/RagA family TonB-linked outer membrane protein [Dyadobacter pollutisoli]WAC10171.1 SusC/RagA family TonB-linked outer membrane protein [Dyadobacter pollutisoli]